MGNLIRVMGRDSKIVVSVVNSVKILQKMEEIHKTSAVVSAALGRLLTAASLIGSNLKSEENSLTLRVNGGGPVGTLVAISDGWGHVRGYAQHPLVELPPRADGKLDVGGVVGQNGLLSLVRDTGVGRPYVGQTALISGEIAEDLTAYYSASEQTPCVCALGVLVEKDLSVAAGGGYLLTLLPGASEEEILLVEKNLKKMPPVTQLLAQGAGPMELAAQLLASMELQLLDERELEYRCSCSQTRTQNILASLGKKELQNMQKENPMAQAECHFCNKTYEIDIVKLLAKL